MHYTESIRMAREAKHLTQAEAAKRIGVATNSISRWETGETVPNALNLIKMGEVYEVTLDTLCGVS